MNSKPMLLILNIYNPCVPNISYAKIGYKTIITANNCIAIPTNIANMKTSVIKNGNKI